MQKQVVQGRDVPQTFDRVPVPVQHCLVGCTKWIRSSGPAGNVLAELHEVQPMERLAFPPPACRPPRQKMPATSKCPFFPRARDRCPRAPGPNAFSAIASVNVVKLTPKRLHKLVVVLADGIGVSVVGQQNVHAEPPLVARRLAIIKIADAVQRQSSFQDGHCASSFSFVATQEPLTPTSDLSTKRIVSPTSAAKKVLSPQWNVFFISRPDSSTAHLSARWTLAPPVALVSGCVLCSPVGSKLPFKKLFVCLV